MPVIVAAALEYFGVAAATAAIASEIIVAIASVYTLREQQRKAQNAQKDAYNASLRDRYIMSRSATDPRQMVLGRQRVAGTMAYIGSYGANKEHLIFAMPIAAHEIDAVEAIYFDNELVTLDGSGNVTGVNRREQFTISTGGAAFTLASNPQAGSVTAVVKYGTTSVTLGVSVAGAVVTVSGATNGQTGTVTISYRPDPSPFAPVGVVSATQTVAINGSGNGSVTLSHVPIGGSVTVTYDPGGNDPVNGFYYSQDLTSFSGVAGSVVTITASTTVSVTATVSYQWSDATTKANVRWLLGGAGQVADAAMIAALPGVWTSAHVGNGIAYLICQFDYDPNAFPSGIPNVSAQVRGAKVYDPRTGLTAWSENPALLMRHAATSPLCGRLSTTFMNDTNISAVANICDASVTYAVNGQNYTRAKYTAGSVVKSGTRAVDVLNDLAQAMAGKYAFIDGLLRIKGGAYSTPLQTLDDTWLSGASPIQIQPKANRADVFNIATGKFADETTDYQVLDFPRVPSAAYIAEDGAELPLDIQLNAVTFSGQAQQIVATMMRDARQGMRLTVLCNMRAYPVELFDTLYVTLSRYGWVNKPFEVVDVNWTIDGGIQLSMKETSSTIWDLGVTFAATDPAPNTLLPSPFVVADLAGLACTSVGQYLLQSDGTVTSRISATWSAIADQAVLASGGGVEIRYGLSTTSEAAWRSVEAPSDRTQWYLSDVIDSAIYLIKARCFNALVRGKWSAPVLHQVTAKTAVPINVAGFTATQVPGGVLLAWTKSTDSDYLDTELHVEGSWNNATTPLFRGAGTSYLWPWPAAATYTVLAKHRNFSRVLSTTAASASVTVNSSGLINTGQVGTDAATTVLKDLVASNSQSSSLSGLGVLVMQINSTLTYTNSTGGAVEVEVSWSAAHTVTVGASPAGTCSVHGMFIDGTVNGSAFTYSDPSGFDVPSIGNSTSKSWRIANTWHFSLAAGDVLVTQTKVQFQGTASLPVTLATTNAALRATVVKR